VSATCSKAQQPANNRVRDTALIVALLSLR
jgi:hypothetical protein